MRKLLVLTAIAACGPKPAPAPIPTLPGDGDAHVAKPAPSKDAAPDPWAGRTDLIAAPQAKAPTAVELPKIESFKLTNGLEVFLIKSDRLPVVSMQVAVKAGRMHEPHARLGVSELTADMLVKGTKKRDAVSLAKAIDFVGGTIAADATFEATLVSCSVLARNAGTCLELLPEVLTQPAFPDAELAKVRERLIGEVRRRLDDAGQMASAQVQNLLWGNDHVRGWINNEQALNALKRDDLVTWHKQWFVPGNTVLVVSGDIDPKKMRGDLERAFGGWAKGPVPPAPTYKEPGLSGSRIRLVDKPGQTQTHIRIAQFGIKHDDPRFFDTLVWNYVLGGGAFSSRLMKVVRVDGGKTYGASSSFDRNLDRGSFVAQTFTRNSEAVATSKLVLNEILKMQKDGPTKDEVAAAVANIAGGYGLRFQSAADVGAALIGAELHNFGENYLQNFPLAVGQVDVTSAKAAAGSILNPKAFVIVMVGDAKDLEPQLKKEGWEYQKVAYTDPIGGDAPKSETPVDPKAAAQARALIDEALAAKGGKAKLAGLKSLKMTASGTTVINGQNVTIDLERVYVAPDKLRFDATLAGKIKVTTAVAGKTGWLFAPDQTGQTMQLLDLQGTDMQSVDFERWREPELILLKAQDPAAKATLAADETVDGKPCSVIKLQSPFGGVEVSLYVDKKTKLISRMSYSEGGKAETDDFSDYKEVSGIKVAYKRAQTAAGRTTAYELKVIEIDSKIDPTVFDKPKELPKK